MRIASTVLILALLGGCADSGPKAHLVDENEERATLDVEVRAAAHALSLYLNGMVPPS